jgi:hypothetical protein
MHFKLAVLVAAVALLLIPSFSGIAQTHDWRLTLGGGVGATFPAGELFSNVDNGMSWNAGFRIHRLKGFSRVGGLFGGGSVQGASISDSRMSWMSLESGYAFPIAESGTHGYVAIGLNIYYDVNHVLERSGYKMTSSVSAGPKFQGGLGIALSGLAGIDVNAAMEILSLRINGLSEEIVKSGVLFSLSTRLYFQLVDF